MYELRGRRVVRVLIAPLDHTFNLALCALAFFLLIGGGWLAIPTGSFLVVFFVRTYFTRLTADDTGVTVTNRFSRERIPWREIHRLSIPAHRIRTALLPVLHIEFGFDGVFTVPVQATLGMRRAEQEEVSVELARLADRYDC